MEAPIRTGRNDGRYVEEPFLNFSSVEDQKISRRNGAVWIGQHRAQGAELFADPLTHQYLRGRRIWSLYLFAGLCCLSQRCLYVWYGDRLLSLCNGTAETTIATVFRFLSNTAPVGAL